MAKLSTRSNSLVKVTVELTVNTVVILSITQDSLYLKNILIMIIKRFCGFRTSTIKVEARTKYDKISLLILSKFKML